MRTKIIAEFASSWNADADLMKAMIKAASQSGADICKLQDYQAKNVPYDDLDKARYEKYQMRDELYPQFIKWCEEYGVEPLTSCFNVDRVEFLAAQGLKKIKIASICLTNTDLLMMAGAHFDEVILSTAMQNREDIEEAIDILATNAKHFTVMACTANYPTYIENANLERMNELKRIIGDQEYASVGYSSHALDVDVPKAVIAMGAKYVEVHFSLSREMLQIAHQMFKGGPMITTHSISLEPQELKEIADWRDKVEIIHGSGDFQINKIEKGIHERYSKRYGV